MLLTNKPLYLTTFSKLPVSWSLSIYQCGRIPFTVVLLACEFDVSGTVVCIRNCTMYNPVGPSPTDPFGGVINNFCEIAFMK